VPQLPRNELDWLTSYMAYTNNSEPADLYRLWSGISAIAACLQRKCFLPWHTDVYPNMYIVLVGQPACRKSTAFKPIQLLLRDLPGVVLAAQSTTREALIRRMTECTASIILEDGTTLNSSSITLHSSEFNVFLGHNNPTMLSFLTDIFDCEDPWTYDTKNKGTDIVAGVWFNLIGAITPRSLQQALPHDTGIEGGLSSRIIFIYADRGKVLSFPSKFDVTTGIGKRLKDDLEQICMLKGRFSVTEGWRIMWDLWYQQNGKDCALPYDLFGGYIQRRAVHILKLSMIISASEGNSLIIDNTHLARAIVYLKEAEQVMLQAFVQYGRTDLNVITGRVMLFISATKEVAYHTIMTQFMRDMNVDELNVVLRTVRASGRYNVKVVDNESIWYEVDREKT